MKAPLNQWSLFNYILLRVSKTTLTTWSSISSVSMLRCWRRSGSLVIEDDVENNKLILTLLDTYFHNGIDSYLHAITRPNKLLRISENGDITYSMRYHIQSIQSGNYNLKYLRFNFCLDCKNYVEKGVLWKILTFTPNICDHITAQTDLNFYLIYLLLEGWQWRPSVPWLWTTSPWISRLVLSYLDHVSMKY